MANTASPTRATYIANASFLIAAAAATLWDFKLFDLRLFDALAVACLGVHLVLLPEPRTGFMARRRNYWLLFSVIIFYAALGYVLHAHRSSSAIAAPAAMCFVLIRLSLETGRILAPMIRHIATTD